MIADYRVNPSGFSTDNKVELGIRVLQALDPPIGRGGKLGKFGEPYIPKNIDGSAVKTVKTPAGNTKIDKEPKGVAHTQLRQDKTGNYAQRTTFDAKGRKRSDTHHTRTEKKVSRIHINTPIKRMEEELLSVKNLMNKLVYNHGKGSLGLENL